MTKFIDSADLIRYLEEGNSSGYTFKLNVYSGYSQAEPAETFDFDTNTINSNKHVIHLERTRYIWVYKDHIAMHDERGYIVEIYKYKGDETIPITPEEFTEHE